MESNRFLVLIPSATRQTFHREVTPMSCIPVYADAKYRLALTEKGKNINRMSTFHITAWYSAIYSSLSTRQLMLLLSVIFIRSLYSFSITRYFRVAIKIVTQNWKTISCENSDMFANTETNQQKQLSLMSVQTSFGQCGRRVLPRLRDSK